MQGRCRMRLKKRQKIAIGAFIVFEALWYILYLTRVIPKSAAYAAVVACFIFGFLFFISKGNLRDRSGTLLVSALFLTCIADIFMGFFEDVPGCVEAGVTIFFAVQAIYSVRISAANKSTLDFSDKRFKRGMIIRCAVIAAALFTTLGIFWGRPVLTERTYLIFITTVYIANAACNAVISAATIRKNPLVAPGLFLLLVCDVFLGIVFLGVPVNRGYLADVNIAWIFYLPSQPLLTLSIFTEKAPVKAPAYATVLADEADKQKTARSR